MDLKYLFPTYTHNYIAEAIMEGTIGKVWLDDETNPHVAVLIALDGKLHILGGDAGHPAARTYLEALPGFSMLFVGANGWKELLYEVQEGKVIKMKRYAFSSENLDRAHLKALQTRLSPEFRIEKITPERAQALFAERERWREDQFFGFAAPEDFIERGLGYCALHDDQVVCIAAAGTASSSGFEVQIDTHPKFYRRGLATATGAALLSDCLAQGINPNWDAANTDSAGLAVKLGYLPQGEYDMYYYLGSKFLVNLRSFLRKIRGKTDE